jgi:predicted ATPase
MNASPEGSFVTHRAKANRFVRETGRDLVALQALMWHSRPDTTQVCTDEADL